MTVRFVARMPVVLTLFTIPLLTGCGKETTITSTLMLEPHSSTTLNLNPETVRQIELDNRGRGTVSLCMIDPAMNQTVKVNLGTLGHYKGTAEGMQSLVLQNTSDLSATIDYVIHGKDGAGVEVELTDEATPPSQP